MKYLLRNKKRIILVSIVLVLTVFSFYYIYENSINHDTLLIKQEYESLNGQETIDHNYYQNTYIKNNAPIKKITLSKTIDIINNENAIIFIGFKECPWCRNALPILIETAIENKQNIYYLDAITIRDEYSIVKGELKKTKKASKKYYELLNLLDDYLEEYIIKDDNGKEYDTNEKRLYVPIVVASRDGRVVGTHTGTVDLNNNQTKYDHLTEEQKILLKNIYNNLINKVNNEVCSIGKEC